MTTKRRGRPANNPHEATISAKLPRPLIDAIDRFADAEFCDRRAAIESLLRAGLEATSK